MKHRKLWPGCKKVFCTLMSLLLTPGILMTFPLPASGADVIDLEFSTESAVKGFKTDGGTVAYADGRLIWSPNGGHTLTSPTMPYTSGTAYGVKLELRNTFCVRMANHTDATQLRLYFATDSQKGFDKTRSEVFAVQPQSGDETYYFNLSGNPLAKGKLTGFRFELIGADSGRVELEAITFEHEKPVYAYAGKLTSCTTTADSVVIKGTLHEQYAGKTVDLYETEVENYTEALKSGEKVTSVRADGTAFEITLPLMKGKVSRLSSLFLLGVDGVRLCDRFMVENWRDTLTNPYAYATAAKTVTVTDAPYNACGDGFTNDTDAIQKAINEVSAAGGGKVIVPGSDSEYGRRYIVTTLRLMSGVELHLEKGSVLWQSPRPADYPYEVVYGHDVSIPGINWTHAGLCKNYPIIYAYEADHIKLTGEGTVRSVDTGSECLDSVSGDTIWVGCENRIHVISVAMQYCDDVEISDVHIRRANCYHMMVRNCHRVYIANVDMREATCASGDGIGISAGCTDVVVDRCILYSNDDAVTLCTSYNDPRGLTWWQSTPDRDNSIRRVNIRSCNLFGGHGITFIPWGTDDPNLANEVIDTVSVTDCVLTGGSCAIGTWPDNPYFGGSFTNTETDDFSPVQNVTLLGNRCRGKADLECLRVTGLVSDCGLKAATDFQYGSFEHRKVKVRGSKVSDWQNGLSNWEIMLGGMPADGAREAERDGNAVAVGKEDTNHYGILTGNASLYQGLYMSTGKHHLSVDVRMPERGTATLFARNRVTGETVAEKEIRANREGFFTNILTFALDKAAVLDLGVTTASGTFYIDNARVTSEPVRKTMYFTEDFENGESVYMSALGMNEVNEEGNTFLRSEGGLGSLTAANEYTSYQVTYRMRYSHPTWEVDGNFGICACRKGDNYLFLEYNTPHQYLQVRCFKDGQTYVLYQKSATPPPVGEWVDASLTVDGNRFVWVVDGETFIDIIDAKLVKGNLHFNFYNTFIDIDDICVTPFGDNAAPEYETSAPAPDPTEAEFIPDPEPETEPETDPATEPATQPETEPVADPTEPETAPAEAPSASETEDATQGAPSHGCASSLAGMTGVAVLTTVAASLAIRKKKDKDD